MSSPAARLVSLLFCLALATGVLAGEAPPAADDPALEQRVTALASELRCLVCQNQTIADSNAGLAVDLRNEIRERLRGGQTEAQIMAFMVERYGDFVLYRPPFRASTLVLWLGPLLLLLVGLFALYRMLSRRTAAAEPRLTDAERERAARLLDGARGGIPR
jgi:cytochrome c-type biogenesis protein CcmH